MKGLRQTGVTLFKLDEGVDSGEIVSQHIVPVDLYETATTLYHRIATAHISLISNTWPKLLDGSVKLVPQIEENATFWPGRTPADGKILNTMTVYEIERLVRAVTHPYPGAFFDGTTERIIVWEGKMFETPNSIAIPACDGIYWATKFSRIDLSL